jgi:hypothetical protein
MSCVVHMLSRCTLREEPLGARLAIMTRGPVVFGIHVLVAGPFGVELGGAGLTLPHVDGLRRMMMVEMGR